MITADDVQRVQSSWARISPISDTVGDLFFRRLIELKPSLRLKYSGDTASSRRLIQSLAVFIHDLTKPCQIIPVIQSGARSPMIEELVREGAAAVTEALLWSLQSVNGDRFSPDLRLAWKNVAALLVDAAATPETAQ